VPTYEYACRACGEHLEVVQSFRDDPLTTCPACGSPLRKVFGSIGVVFKGSGFYKNDSRTAAKESTPSKDAKPSTTAESSSETSGSSKDSSGTKEKVSSSDSSSGSSSNGKDSPKSGSSSEKAGTPAKKSAAS